MDLHKTIRTRSDPKLLYCIAGLLWLTTVIAGQWEESRPKPVPKLIHWSSIGEAASKSLAQNKPILYIFSAAWCPPCKQMERFALGRQDIADQINKCYVPVLVMDQEQELGANPPEIKKLEDKYKVRSFPTLIAVHPKFISATSTDLFSIGNGIQRRWLESEEKTNSRHFQEDWDGWVESGHWHIPGQQRYSGPKDLAYYLYSARLWHQFLPDRGKIKWREISTLNQSSTLPKMIVMIEDSGSPSDRMRIHLFDDDLTTEFIAKHFVPFLVEFKRGKPDTPELAALKKRFGINQLPAIIVLDNKQPPQIMDGFAGRMQTLQFLARPAEVDLRQLKKETDWKDEKKDSSDD
jgi:thiol-disulfide isomerase/thioredoxin